MSSLDSSNSDIPGLDIAAAPRSPLASEVARRRTFAIISHPDAGKTTLTEKLLLFGGAINVAGQVKAKGERRNTRSDWMKIERDRGISVVTSVMTFEFEGRVFNLLDTPGHEDFSEDTYRTLTAVDSAVMVIDAAKGIEARTRKLFEVCRLRDIPIVTFINKMDRESRDVFELLDEIEKTLALDTTPMTWPIGPGRAFCGTYDLRHNVVRKLDAEADAEPMKVSGPDDPQIATLAGEALAEHTAGEIELAMGASKPFDKQAFLEGHLTPVFFGSALRNFGVRDLIDAMAELAPPPRGLDTASRHVDPREAKMTGFVFKIQANMDPNHRDRIAFLRVTSGKLARGMKAKLIRTGKNMALNAPQFFFAQDRTIADEAYAGDVVGIPNHGVLRIGDTLTEGETLRVTGIPSFAPELLQGVRAGDPMKAKHLEKALMQFAEEGAAKVFKPAVGSGFVVGVVGALQFEVLASRIELEYGLPVRFEASRFTSARWVKGERRAVDAFVNSNKQHIAHDHDGDIVYLTRLQWDIDRVERDFPDLTLSATKEMMV